MNSKTIIGRQELLAARETLRHYKQGKANLEQRIIQNEQWYKMRHWECMRREKQAVEPVSGWLFNAIANKHADAMDNIPAATILPREEDDRAEAQLLSAIVPVVLEQNDFETVYHKLWDQKLRSGTGVYGVFWDKEKLGGLGDIALQRVDVLNLFWEGGITDIQDSRNLFHVALRDDDLLLAQYPELEGKLGGESGELSRYLYDDTVDTTGKSAVVDWYYKRTASSISASLWGIRCCFPRKIRAWTAGMTMENTPLSLTPCSARRVPPAASATSMWASPPRSTSTGAIRQFCRICWQTPAPGTSSAATAP